MSNHPDENVPPTPEDLPLRGEVVPELTKGWDLLPEDHQKIWRSLADPVLPVMIRFFQPRFVQIRYCSPYEGWLVLVGDDQKRLQVGPINLITVRKTL